MKDLTAAYDSETRSQESGDSSHPGAAIDTGATPFSPREARWTLAYLGILAYLVVEYTRLPAMFPVLRVLNLGKVVIVMCLLGIALEPRARVALDRATSWIKICLVALLIVGLMAATLTKYQETTWRGFRDAGVYVLVA
ncbi:MAG: hypothetical protein HY508_01215, partial [Acidobacteria bacterium]|nr:hypothetical protein [Acidobacteriota bacterium]